MWVGVGGGGFVGARGLGWVGRYGTAKLWMVLSHSVRSHQSSGMKVAGNSSRRIDADFFFRFKAVWKVLADFSFFISRKCFLQKRKKKIKEKKKKKEETFFKNLCVRESRLAIDFFPDSSRFVPKESRGTISALRTARPSRCQSFSRTRVLILSFHASVIKAFRPS